VLQGIGMRVLAYDIKPNPAVEAMEIPYASIEEILPQADVVSLHVPLLPSTFEIMNKPRWVHCTHMSRLSCGACAINYGHLLQNNHRRQLYVCERCP